MIAVVTVKDRNHVRPIRSTSKLKRAYSSSSMCTYSFYIKILIENSCLILQVSSSTSTSLSVASNDLNNIDPRDPHILYPSYYIAPPGFVIESSDSTSSEDEEMRINDLPLNFKGKLFNY